MTWRWRNCKNWPRCSGDLVLVIPATELLAMDGGFLPGSSGFDFTSPLVGEVAARSAAGEGRARSAPLSQLTGRHPCLFPRRPTARVACKQAPTGAAL